MMTRFMWLAAAGMLMSAGSASGGTFGPVPPGAGPTLRLLDGGDPSPSVVTAQGAPRGLRIATEVLAGMVGEASFVMLFAAQGSSSGLGIISPNLVLIPMLGVPLGASLGVGLAGHLLGGDGSLWALGLGTVAGTAVGLAVGLASARAAFGSSGGYELTSPGLLYIALAAVVIGPLAGAVLGYELSAGDGRSRSSHARREVSAPRIVLAPAPGGNGVILGLAGQT